MTEFKVGDRVRCVNRAIATYNKIGIVRHKGVTRLAVDYDDFTDGHSFDGAYGCRPNHGWWTDADDLQKINTSGKVIIYAQGNTVTAKLVEDKKITDSAVAKCSPDDSFDVLVGAQIALQRLVEQQGSKFVLNTKMFKDIEVL